MKTKLNLGLEMFKLRLTYEINLKFFIDLLQQCKIIKIFILINLSLVKLKFILTQVQLNLSFLKLKALICIKINSLENEVQRVLKLSLTLVQKSLNSG